MNRNFTIFRCACAFVCAVVPVLPLQAQLGFDSDAISLVVPSTGAVAQQGMLVLQGDIFVSPVTHSNVESSYVNFVQERGFGRSKASALWSNGIIDYSLDASLDSAQRDRIREAVAHWNDNTKIRLREYSPLNPGHIQPLDYLDFKSGPGCASWVGRQGGAQTVWISNDCNTGSILHEVGHAVGLLHEHTRLDRDSHISVLLENVEPGKSVNFDILASGARHIGPYDYDSIMHYGSRYFSSTGNATLLPLNGKDPDSIGQREKLSSGDIAAINDLYSSDASLSVFSTYDAVADSTRVQLDVSILHYQGVHDLWLELTTQAKLDFYESMAGWSCRDLPNGIGCSLSELGSLQSSQLLLDIPGRHEINARNTGLVTRTLDNNPANNGKAVSSPSDSLVVAAALSDGVEAAELKKGGAGALHLPSLLALIVVWLFAVSDLFPIAKHRFES